MQVDILEFQVPVENNKTLFVWDIQPGSTEAQLYEQLLATFSPFGPLYLLKVCPNAPQQPPGFYAIVKFYSATHASAAQKHTDGRSLFQSAALKVRLSSKQTPHFLFDKPRLLSHARCVELANHCLGFNGWTSDIIQLTELPSEAEEAGEQDGERTTPGDTKTVKLGCLLQLSFPGHGVTTRGAAVVEDSFTCTGPEVFLQKRCRLRRMVRDKALVQAFSSVLIILIGNGKVMVELKQDQNTDEKTEGLLQVNEFSWPDADEDEAEVEEFDLTVS